MGVMGQKLTARYHNAESILARCKPNGECLEWLGVLSGSGYPCISLKGKNYRGNRLIWTLVNGPIPQGLFILHSCDNKKCLNPQHLRAGTHQENMQDIVKRKRHPLHNLTRCKNGHEFTPENTQIGPNKKNACRACKREWWRKTHNAKPRKFKLKKMDGVE